MLWYYVARYREASYHEVDTFRDVWYREVRYGNTQYISALYSWMKSGDVACSTMQRGDRKLSAKMGGTVEKSLRQTLPELRICSLFSVRGTVTRIRWPTNYQPNMDKAKEPEMKQTYVSKIP